MKHYWPVKPEGAGIYTKSLLEKICQCNF